MGSRPCDSGRITSWMSPWCTPGVILVCRTLLAKLTIDIFSLLLFWSFTVIHWSSHVFLSSHCVLFWEVSPTSWCQTGFMKWYLDSGLDVAGVKPNFTVNLCFNKTTSLFQRLVLLTFFPLATENIILYLMFLTDVKIRLKSLTEVNPSPVLKSYYPATCRCISSPGYPDQVNGLLTGLKMLMR